MTWYEISLKPVTTAYEKISGMLGNMLDIGMIFKTTEGYKIATVSSPYSEANLRKEIKKRVREGKLENHLRIRIGHD